MKKIIRILKRILFGESPDDCIIEGLFAHQYTDEKCRKIITEKYKERYTLVANPVNTPEKYDPLTPPKGWVYDPYYEMWMEINE